MGIQELDKIDVEILAHLQQDGRKSFTDIAEGMNTSVGTVRNRYNRLLENNILHNIGWIEPVMVGYNSYVKVNIIIKPTTLKKQVAEELLKLPEASFVAFTSGTQDIEAHFICKDNIDFINLMNNVIHKIEGVYNTNTTVYLKVLKWASHNVNISLNNKKIL